MHPLDPRLANLCLLPLLSQAACTLQDCTHMYEPNDLLSLLLTMEEAAKATTM
jgi:hypothetical protein